MKITIERDDGDYKKLRQMIHNALSEELKERGFPQRRVKLSKSDYDAIEYPDPDAEYVVIENDEGDGQNV